MNRLFPIALALALAPFAAHDVAARNSQTDQKPLVAQTLNSFEQDSARIRKDMQPGGKYGYISSTERSHVEARLDDMQKLLTTNKNASDMPETDKVALFNAQEEINGILNHNDNNRMVCERSMPVGSHIPVTTCHTYAEIMAQRARAQHDMERSLSTPQYKSGG